MQLRAHTENLVVQTIEDELVLVDLRTGSYFSLTGSAAIIFSELDSGLSPGKLLDSLSVTYGVDLKSHEEEINHFVQQLQNESLLVSGIGTCQINIDDFRNKPFALPVLSKYEDLQDLLLIDPVRGLPSTGG